MRPSFLDDMSWAMAEVYGSVTDRLLVNLARHFPYIKNADQIRGSFDYQARLLAQMGQVNRESVDIIMQSLGGADAALRASLEAAILEALKSEEPKLRKAAQQGLLNGSGMLPAEVTPNQMQAFQVYYRQSVDKLNLVNTVMLESTQAAYQATVADVTARIARSRSTLNVGAGEVVTGVSAWNTAMREAVGKMVANGLTGFVDHAGRKWTPEAYVAMDIRTTMFNTAREAISERAQEFGCDLYQVSSHNGARPLCYPWQGKVISRSGWTGTVKDLYGDDVTVHSEDEIESFRWGGGLFGVNCRHYPMNFIPGFSTLKGQPQDPEENEQAYAESQQQRALERRLREERRDLAILKAQGAGEDEIRAQRERVNRASANIDDFCDEHGLPRRRSREYTPVNATFPPEDSYNQKVFPREKKEQMGEFFGLNSPGERGIIEGRKARVFNADGTEAYRYPKSDVIQKMTSSEEINEYFSKTDWRGERQYLFSGAFQDMPLDHQKALAESVLYMQETFKPKEWPSTIRVQKTATVDGLKVAGYYDPGLRKIVVSTEGSKSEGELYKTVIHELIHHYDRYGDEAEYCVKKAVSGLMERVNPETGLLYSTSEVDFLKADLAGVYATDDAELLAYSIEQNLSIRASHNPLGQEISRLFEERNARQ